MPQEPALGSLGEDGEDTLGGLFSRLKSTEVVAELIQKQKRKNEWESEMQQHSSLSAQLWQGEWALSWPEWLHKK